MLRALRNQTQSFFLKFSLFCLFDKDLLYGVSGDLTGGTNSKPILETNNLVTLKEQSTN